MTKGQKRRLVVFKSDLDRGERRKKKIKQPKKQKASKARK